MLINIDDLRIFLGCMFNMGNTFNSGLAKVNLKDAYAHLTNVYKVSLG